MSNRTDLSNMRATLQDLLSDLQGVQLRIIAIQPAADVRKARGHMQEAIGCLTDALGGDVDIRQPETSSETSAAERS